MAMKNYVTSLFMLCWLVIFGQNTDFTSKEISISPLIEGTLLTPHTTKKPPLVMIIAGSGPTDRNGNQNFLKSDNLKKLAEALVNNNVATFRYDKRTVKQLKLGRLNDPVLFTDFVTDAQVVIKHFKKLNTFSKIIIVGHSQGSLVGMLASEHADAFISLAGAGQSIDQVILEQIKNTAPMYLEDTKKVFGILKSGKTTSEYPLALSTFLGTEIQPFMMSWMQHNPQELLKNMSIPTLIINGTRDLQVSVSEAHLLAKAAPNAQLIEIENMNHVLVEVSDDSLENYKSYSDASFALSEKLIESILLFIKSI